MNTKLILSTGCVLLIMFASFTIGGAIIVHGILLSDREAAKGKDYIPSRLNKPVGEIGLKAMENDLKYGPVNQDATKEAKDGIIDRIRARRNAISNPSVCQPVTTVSNCQPAMVPTTRLSTQVVSYQENCVPINQVHSIQPAQLQASAVNRTIPEQPSINPFYLDQVETFFRKQQCPDCPLFANRPVSEVKTGAFICSHCRKPKFGDEWHTDWRDDGTPITFLCEKCFQSMSVAQRIQTYKAYAARQIASGKELVYQEVE